MNYRIRPGEPLTDEVVRIAGLQYRKAIGILRSEPDGRHQAIHDARKRFKRLRGLFRLIREAAPDFYARENARIRDTASTLSAVRDATSLVEVVDRMAADSEPGEDRAVLISVRDRLAARRDRIAAGQTDLGDRITAAILACEQGSAALADLRLPKGNDKAIDVLAAGAAKNYGRAVKALARARESEDPEDWHDLRKRIKYHWMHIQLLKPAWPGVMAARAEIADLAGDLLGDDHDLAVLAELIAAEPGEVGSATEIAVLRAHMHARTLRLHKEIRKILKRLLKDDAKVLRSRIAALYRDASG